MNWIISSRSSGSNKFKRWIAFSICSLVSSFGGSNPAFLKMNSGGKPKACAIDVNVSGVGLLVLFSILLITARFSFANLANADCESSRFSRSCCNQVPKLLFIRNSFS